MGIEPMRSSAAFQMGGLAIITPAADPFDPKTIRSSMGAVFSLPFSTYPSFEDYLKLAGARQLYPFMIAAKLLSLFIEGEIAYVIFASRVNHLYLLSIRLIGAW